MRLHEGAVTAAARAVHLDRYRMHAVSDEQLATLCIEAYYEAKPDRSRRPAPPPPKVPPA